MHLKQQKCVCHRCGDKVQTPGVSRAGFSPWLVGGRFIPVPSHGLCRAILISSHKDSSPMGLEPTLLTSFDLIISVSKCNYILHLVLTFPALTCSSPSLGAFCISERRSPTYNPEANAFNHLLPWLQLWLYWNNARRRKFKTFISLILIIYELYLFFN